MKSTIIPAFHESDSTVFPTCVFPTYKCLSFPFHTFCLSVEDSPTFFFFFLPTLLSLIVCFACCSLKGKKNPHIPVKHSSFLPTHNLVCYLPLSGTSLPFHTSVYTLSTTHQPSKCVSIHKAYLIISHQTKTLCPPDCFYLRYPPVIPFCCITSLP